MKEQFLSKWSNWWSLRRDAKQLNDAFARELNELIERELALRQPPVAWRSELFCADFHSTDRNGICFKCGKQVFVRTT